MTDAVAAESVAGEAASDVAVIPKEKPAKKAIILATDKDIQTLLATADYKVTDIHDKTQLETLQERKMAFVRMRTSIDKSRKEMNEEYKRIIDENNANAKKWTLLLAPGEEKLKLEQSRVEKEIVAERERKEAELLQTRRSKMKEINWDLPDSAVKAMSDEVFEDMFVSMNAAFLHNKKLQEEAAQAAALLEEQRRKEAEEQRLREEAEAEAKRAQAEAEERARLEREAEIQRQAEEVRKEREKLAAEAAEATRLREEEAARQREELQAERDRIAAEAAEVQRRRDEEDQRRREEQEALRREREELEAERRRHAEEVEAARRGREQIAEEMEATQRALEEERLAKEQQAEQPQQPAPEDVVPGPQEQLQTVGVDTEEPVEATEESSSTPTQAQEEASQTESEVPESRPSAEFPWAGEKQDPPARTERTLFDDPVPIDEMECEVDKQSVEDIRNKLLPALPTAYDEQFDIIFSTFTAGTYGKSGGRWYLKAASDE